MHRTTGGDLPDASTIVSRSPGKAYERMREARPTHFDQPVGRKLLAVGGLLALLAATFGSALLGDALPSADGPGTAAPVAVGAVAALLLVAGALGLGGVAAYRLRTEPLTERQALRVLAVEDAASYLGLGTGGLLAVGAVLATAFDLGSSVAAAGPVAPTAEGVAVVAGVAAAGAVAAGRALRGRLPRRG